MRDRPAFHRRALLAGFGAGAAMAPLAVPSSAIAQPAWRPNRPVRMVVPFPPSGSNDVLGRALSEGLAGRLGQPVVVENRAGAGGIIGATSVARAEADGLTLLFISSNFAIGPAVQRLPYNPATDFIPVFQAAEAPMIVTVGRESTARSLRDLLRVARENPGRLRFGATGTGDVNYFASQLLATQANVAFEPVIYRGASDAQIDLVAGRIELLVTTLASARGLIDSGDVRVLAIATPERSPALPNVPTAREEGVDYVTGVWWGVFAPARVPPAAVAAFHDEAAVVARTPAFQRVLEMAGAAHVPMTQPDFAAKVMREINDWRAIAERLGIVVN
jgi:tripartite-type tricarboxylate transporter receptor subunit TctC